MVDAIQVAELRRFVEQLKLNPSILHDPSLVFFKEYLRSLGAQVPKIEKTVSCLSYELSMFRFLLFVLLGIEFLISLC
jgi:hypothetical protein